MPDEFNLAVYESDLHDSGFLKSAVWLLNDGFWNKVVKKISLDPLTNKPGDGWHAAISRGEFGALGADGTSSLELP
ncbi:hypothetical protein CFP56_009884 [Quercus suber]|uniref:Uncharacterized protein n=1 Tax=Quercus suber TaxID=58331 RepID=A0AAW0L2E6_QUESU